MGGFFCSPSVRNAPGRSTATVPASARAFMPAVFVYSKWSAERAPNCAASSAPLQSLS